MIDLITQTHQTNDRTTKLCATDSRIFVIGFSDLEVRLCLISLGRICARMHVVCLNRNPRLDILRTPLMCTKKPVP